jgi:hypothetical protein
MFSAVNAECASKDEKKSIIKARIPSISMTPNLNSVMKKVNKNEQKEEIETNGDVINSNIIVDDIEDPKCVFYGNYNSGSSDAEQYFDIETIIFECE